MLNIISASTTLEVTNINIMLYGPPGVRKTSIACSADSPLLINFDGIQNSLKAFGRPDSIHIAATSPSAQHTSWESLRNMGASELSGYRTLVIDTAGRMVDTIGLYVEAVLGVPQSNKFRYYGEIKSQALYFFSKMAALGLDIVYVAHEKSEEARKKQIIAPLIPGGSGGEIYRDCIVIGYLCAGPKGKVLIDFELDEDRIGKNYGLAAMEVPMLEDEPAFLSKILMDIKSRLTADSSKAQQSQAVKLAWEKLVQKADCVEDINDLVGMIREDKELSKASKAAVKNAIVDRAKVLVLKFQKDEGKYVKLL